MHLACKMGAFGMQNWVHLACTLGAFGVQFWCIWRAILVYFESVVGAFWVHFWVYFWVHLECILRAVDGFWGSGCNVGWV